MLSCHHDPFTAFCTDLQLPGCEVHLYKGPNTFGGLCRESGFPAYPWWDTENVYFLAGVKPGLMKRAADSDVLMRSMFTLDFDIRNELIKAGHTPTDASIKDHAETIIKSLEAHNTFKDFRYVVLSGNGMHVHYFGVPTDVRKEEWAAGMKTIFEEVNAITPIPCDTGCGNAGRIMRMPGSWNVKGGGQKPVDVMMWMPNQKCFAMGAVQERGRAALKVAAERKLQERAEFAANNPEGGSDVIDLINRIPVEQIVQQILGCTVGQQKREGGLRFVDEHGKERGFFKHREFNIIVHEGTSLFPPPTGVGYNPLGLVKAVLNCSAREAILWFADRSQAVRDGMERDKEQWVKERQSHEFDYADTILKNL